MNGSHQGEAPPFRDFATRAIDAVDSYVRETYKYLHRHPELSGSEEKTSRFVASELRAFGYDVTTQIGGYGLVGLIDRGGSGPSVLLRADMDGLPVLENTAVPYASEAKIVDAGRLVPIMHACGHDVHMACMLGAARVLASLTGWRGSLTVLFQPAEETGTGAAAMLADGLLDVIPRPTVTLGQHVTSLPAGQIGLREETAMASADNFKVRLFGRGGHSSQPHTAIDPILAVASIIQRIQGVVSREVPPLEPVVVSICSVHGGVKENIIPDHASFTVNIRALSGERREKVKSSVIRIIEAEAVAAGMPEMPAYETINEFPITYNDPKETQRLIHEFATVFGADEVYEMPPKMGSEDFGRIGAAAKCPSVFWFLGGIDRTLYLEAEQAGKLESAVPSTHSAKFSPVLSPTLERGVGCMVFAALLYLSNDATVIDSDQANDCDRPA